MSSAFNVPPRPGLSKNIYDRVDFLISPETKDLSPCILAIVPDAHRVRRSRGIFSSSPSRFPQSRLVAAGSGTRTNAAQPKDW